MQTWYWRFGSHYSDQSAWSSRRGISDDGLCAHVSGYGNAEGCGWEIQRAGFLTATIFNIVDTGDVLTLGSETYTHGSSPPLFVPVQPSDYFQFLSDGVGWNGDITVCYSESSNLQLNSANV